MPQKRLPSLRGGAQILPVLKGIRSAVFLAVTLSLVNLGFFSSLLLYPFSRQAFRGYNRALARIWWSLLLNASRTAIGVRIVVSGDPLPPQENAVVLANHQDMPDIPSLALLAQSLDRVGDLKWFVKDPLKYVPGLGWGMLFLDNIFLKRNWNLDADTIAATFQRITSARAPFWLLMFSEGTRFTPARAQESARWARKEGLEPLRHVLFPRPKGFQATVLALRPHAQAVYDVTLGYPDGVPTLWQYMQGRCGPVHVHVRRFPMDAIPTDDAGQASWLRERFRAKDDLLETFYRLGRFE